MRNARGPWRCGWWVSVPAMTSSGDSTFASELRRFRRDRSFTQEELAERAGLTAKAVGALERGERTRPYPHTVRSLADALGLDEQARQRLASTVPQRRRPASGAEEGPATPGPLQEAPFVVPYVAPASGLIGRQRDV